MYAYEDRYGWTVAAYTGAPWTIRMVALHAPRTFATKAEAQRWIEEQKP